MRQLMILALSLGLLSLPAVAQDFPKAEIFGGYQYTHFDPSGNTNGWNASLTGNVNRWFGVAADFSGAYKSGEHVHTYMFGPVFAARSDKVTPFAHALFGGASGGGTTAFAMAFGGGVDVKVADKGCLPFDPGRLAGVSFGGLHLQEERPHLDWTCLSLLIRDAFRPWDTTRSRSNQ